MPALDHLHDNVRHALIKDGWTITHEDVLAQLEPGRELYLAVPEAVLDTVLADEIGALMLRRRITRVVGFSPAAEEVSRWIP